MQTLLEYAPWIVFGLVYKFGGGLYPATAALMVAMTLLLAYYWIRTRKRSADAPGAHHHGAGVRRGHADPARRPLPAVESIGDLLAHRHRWSPAASGSARRPCSNACWAPACRRAPRCRPPRGAMLAAHRRVLSAARGSQHLGRADPQRGGLGHVQGLDRVAARRWSSSSAWCSTCCAACSPRKAP